jgi:hypothetical protein
VIELHVSSREAMRIGMQQPARSSLRDQALFEDDDELRLHGHPFPAERSALSSNTAQDQEGAFQAAAICSLLIPEAGENDGCWTTSRLTFR